MSDVLNFKLSNNPILQGLLILGIILSGYLFYLLAGDFTGSDLDKILKILSYGVFITGIIFLITGFKSVKDGYAFVGSTKPGNKNYNKYMGHALHVLIAVSVTCIISYYVGIKDFLTYFTISDILILKFCFFIFWTLVFTIGYYIVYEEFLKK